MGVKKLGFIFIGSLLLLTVACTEEQNSQKITGDTDSLDTGDTSTGEGSDTSDTSDEGDSDTGTGDNPCLGDNPPETCHLVPSGPACGDGEINQESEDCDDGNTIPGDGCTGICKIENHYECPTPGEPCIFQFECGNGEIEIGEVCDDGNTVEDDGCNSTCDILDASYICPKEGEPCILVVMCGDGRVEGSETCDEGTNTTVGCVNCKVQEGWVCRYPGQACTVEEKCGDGIVQAAIRNEACDDGNTNDGDGCAANCMYVEEGFTCPTPGADCVPESALCGDGSITGSEVCDDGNSVSGDGCSAACDAVETGFTCPYPGAPCLYDCGDGIVAGTEMCDDGNKNSNDGCSSLCQWEMDWRCKGTAPDYTCEPNVCGDGIGVAQGWNTLEPCDDGNKILGDGCTPFCKIEPDCTVGAGCVSACGDGLVIGAEECDDGNAIDGDGCSSSCKEEPGFTCEQPDMGTTMDVPVVYRDFLLSHADFNLPYNSGGPHGCGLHTGMVSTTLGSDGKPVGVLTYTTACDYQSVSTFATWYSNTHADNATKVDHLRLYDDGTGNFVNRWGPNGEQWTTYSEAWCDNTTCSNCSCSGSCATCSWGTSACCLTPSGSVDGNPVFMPVDTGALPQSDGGWYTVNIPEMYGGGTDPSGAVRNFLFTSEVRFWFKYDSSKSPVLEFVGDDDVWVFINGKLAVDLGGLHAPESGSITINTAKAAELGLTNGKVYEIAVFQAEREPQGSSYKLTLSKFNTNASICTPICGDGVVTVGEECDDGTNTGGYGQCGPGCTLGDYCGDATVQSAYEECDNGFNNDSYGDSGANVCAPNCVNPPVCGDSDVQSSFGETCDDGVNDNSYGGCTDDCLFAPWCGDGIVQPEHAEVCDQGTNDGTYDHCAPGCVWGPRCGDNIVQDEWGEECDGAPVDGKECTDTCKFAGVCGDGVVENEEVCDDGVNDGGYGECAPECVLGPRCGDGVTQSDYEECDAGDDGNTGGYGECAAGCVLGPHCGDGLLQSGYEDCDDGNDNNSDACSNACVKNIFID